MSHDDFLRLLDFLDSKMFDYKTTETGWNYTGLIFDYLFENSVFSIDYLNVEDFFSDKANCKINENERLSTQLCDFTAEQIIRFFEAVILLLHKTQYYTNEDENPKNKIINYLKRKGYNIIIDEQSVTIKDTCVIGEGSYCIVKKVTDSLYKKQLLNMYQSDVEQCKRLKYEFENMSKLADVTGVLNVYEYDPIENSYIMEACEKNLYDFLNEHIGLSVRDRLNIVLQIVVALNAAHEKNIIHRDLHLGNILKKGDSFLLSDFGLSKDLSVIRSLKTTSTPKNAHYFLDPLALNNLKNYDALSDMYSVGKILEYIMTYDGSLLDDEINFIINKATNRIKSKRYSNMSLMYDDISNVINNFERQRLEAVTYDEIKNGIWNNQTNKRIMELINSNKIAFEIVRLKLINFAQIIIQMPPDDQQLLLENLEQNYIDATGYGGFANYEIFSTICYQLLLMGVRDPIQNICTHILEGCSQYRFKSNRQYQELIQKGIIKQSA